MSTTAVLVVSFVGVALIGAIWILWMQVTTLTGRLDTTNNTLRYYVSLFEDQKQAAVGPAGPPGTRGQRGPAGVKPDVVENILSDVSDVKDGMEILRYAVDNGMSVSEASNALMEQSTQEDWDECGNCGTSTPAGDYLCDDCRKLLSE